MSTTMSEPSLVPIWRSINGYQQTAAIKAAVELALFTAIGEAGATAAEAAERCGASERGTRILCDFLAVGGLLSKEGNRYSLTKDTATFLDERSPAYIGGTLEFLLGPMLFETFRDLASMVRAGTTTMSGQGSLEPDNPAWVTFAHAMAPLMRLPADLIARLVQCDRECPIRILDIAAGHGLFGIAMGLQYPNAEVTAVDWAPVLEVAKQNAAAACVSKRYHTIPGSAFEVDYGSGYDLVLLTNFLHHFDPPTNETLLRKVHAALAPGGRAVTLEFVPNPDRVTPPEAAGFSMMMLATTPHGDAYTFAELQSMFRNAGFSRSELHPIPPAVEQVVISYR